MDTLIVEYKRSNKLIGHIIEILKTLKGVKIHIKEDETLMSKEEFFAMVDKRLADYESGKAKVKRFDDEVSLMNYLESI